ncbi:MAG TPA: hypothetical protein EYH12_02885 [Psychromonas hadalis]|nr:hypothetical protein [Psychromonas hadalis]
METEEKETETIKTTGTFIDNPVKGLRYECSEDEDDEDKFTNVDGEYTCPTDSDVSFYVGKIKMGTAKTTSEIITPYTIFPENNAAAINVAKLLQTIDKDGDLENGIEIDSDIAAALDPNLSFEEPGFDEKISTLFSKKRNTKNA